MATMRDIFKKAANFEKAIKSMQIAMANTPAQLQGFADAARKTGVDLDDMVDAFKYATTNLRRSRFDGVLCSRCGEVLRVFKGHTVEGQTPVAWLECEPCGRVLP